VSATRRVLLTGGTGQLGRALLATAPEGVAITAPGRETLDLARPERIEAAVRRVAPDLILNAAAYTAVDRAESDATAARTVNADAVRHLARTAQSLGSRLIHLSTDYVFDGAKGSAYGPDDPPRPLSVYGATKLEGEAAVRELGASGWVLRTSWVYAAAGRNFVLTMLRLMRERPRVRVVADQIGAPTWATSLAKAVWAAAERPSVHGVGHWTDEGATSWYDFAVAIRDEALALGLLSAPVEVDPISTHDFPTAARRPTMSVLDTRDTVAALGFGLTPWRENLRRMLQEVADG
jgi:dTDP-4-dehydrorhamnose reductase